jgi:hypothetical protein
MKHPHNELYDWAIAHPIASLAFFVCAASWGAASDGMRVPEWFMLLANGAALGAGYFCIVRPWLLG